MATYNEFIETIIGALNLPKSFKLDPETEISGVPGWDSFGWVSVILALEELIKRDFPIENIESIKKLSELFDNLNLPNAAIENNYENN